MNKIGETKQFSFKKYYHSLKDWQKGKLRDAINKRTHGEINDSTIWHWVHIDRISKGFKFIVIEIIENDPDLPEIKFKPVKAKSHVTV